MCLPSVSVKASERVSASSDIEMCHRPGDRVEPGKVVGALGKKHHVRRNVETVGCGVEVYRTRADLDGSPPGCVVTAPGREQVRPDRHDLGERYGVATEDDAGEGEVSVHLDPLPRVQEDALSHEPSHALHATIAPPNAPPSGVRRMQRWK